MTVIDRISGVTEGVAIKAPCRLATTGNITLSGLQAIDGITTVANDRVLVRSQSNAVDNGIYTASSGNWTRTLDFDGAHDIVTGTTVFITSGASNANLFYVVSSTGAITVGSSAITFVVAVSTIFNTSGGIDVIQYGADPTGNLDSTTAIQAAINACGAAGGGTVNVPPGTFLISSTLNILHSNIAFIGAGQDGLHNAGTGAAAATILQWDGGAAAMVNFATPSSVTSAIIGACKMSGMELHGNSTATIGLAVNTVRNSEFTNLYVTEVAAAAYLTRCGVAGVDAADDCSVQGCLFRNLQWRLIDTVQSQSANGMDLLGSTTSNTSFNRFEFCNGLTWNGHGFEIVNADNNYFLQPDAHVVVGTGKSIRCYGSAFGAVGGDNNIFVGATYAPGGAVILGTDSGFDQPASNNVFIAYDIANGSDAPTLGTGAHCYSLGSNGFQRGVTNLGAVPTIQAGATYTVGDHDEVIIANHGGTQTLTLPSASFFAGRELTIKTVTANTVVSAASDVVPQIGGAAGTAILAATAGKWAELVSTGSAWEIIRSG